MAGAVEEGVKVVGGVVDAMRSNPLAIANILLNICFLVFLIYYVSIIASRAQKVVDALFAANDKIYTQWGTVVKEQGALVEKAMHCILPEDALKLLQAPPRYEPPPIQRPEPPAPLQRQSAPPSPREHLLPPGPKLQSDESRTIELPPRKGAAGIPGPPGSPSGPPPEKDEP